MQRLCTLGGLWRIQAGVGLGLRGQERGKREMGAFHKHQELYQAPPKYEDLFRPSKMGDTLFFPLYKTENEGSAHTSSVPPDSKQSLQPGVEQKPPLPRGLASKHRENF